MGIDRGRENVPLRATRSTVGIEEAGGFGWASGVPARRSGRLGHEEISACVDLGQILLAKCRLSANQGRSISTVPRAAGPSARLLRAIVSIVSQL
jgi:hypothetical protein